MARLQGLVGHMSSCDLLIVVDWLSGEVPDRVIESLGRPSTLAPQARELVQPKTLTEWPRSVGVMMGEEIGGGA